MPVELYDDVCQISSSNEESKALILRELVSDQQKHPGGSF